ncbi:hypothetical protein V8F20_000775 [Naviculisporaceae sp. PSN 640]
MDSRTSGRMSAARQPLGDATKRVNNTVANVNHHTNPEDRENIVPVKGKKPDRRSSIPLLVNKSATTEPRVARPLPEPPSAVNNRLAVPAPEARPDNNRRVSQLSTASSNASGGRGIKTHIGPWQLGKTLGKGSQARVRLAKHRVTGRLVAIKIVPKNPAQLTQAGSLANLDALEKRKSAGNTTETGLRRMPLAIEREIAILKLVQHPNILSLVDIWENRAEIYMVTEYVPNGDLFGHINANGPLCEKEAVFYFRQMMSALEYCHSFNICHRDLKPENILLEEGGQIKIADFGMAALQQTPSHQLKTACGSPHYAAPELLRHQPYKGSAVDIWSMGVIFFAMVAGRLPFDDADVNVMLTKAKRAQYIMPHHISREAEDFLRRVLVPNGSDRITMKQMWKHPFIRKYDYMADWCTWERSLPSPMKNIDPRPIHDGDVDVQILRQLKSMWHSYSETELKAILAQNTLTDQKVFYWLLYEHRETQLENYNNDIPISKSDFHHLKPPNWGKRISTCKFTEAGPNGAVKSVSKFTVISNVAEQDEVSTVKSYDPYRHTSSQYLNPPGPQVSHAKISVHRNDGDQGLRRSPSNVSHSYASYKSVNGSFQQSSQRAGAVGQFKSPRGSTTGSIRSLPSTPRKVRVDPRTKRGVDFSNVRSGDRRRSDSAAQSRRSKARENSRPEEVVKPPKDESEHWKQELEQLGHHVASYCDEVFGTSSPVAEGNQGLDYLSGVENTIRVVRSSGGLFEHDPSLIPAPLNVRKISQRPSKVLEAVEEPPSLESQRRASDGAVRHVNSFDGNHGVNTAAEKKPRVSSWFKRSSKDGASGSSFATVTEDSAATDEAAGDAHERKKKAFSFPFWKSSTPKDMPKMSLADSDGDENPDGQVLRAKTSKSTVAKNGPTTPTEAEPNASRKIEVQQNWLARLFRVKPAMRYLCFAVPKRRARQHITTLLKAWRDYGIEELQVDKERCVIFASLGENPLRMKKVAFAIELMTVIEHGKRGALCIARFTQERGAASSFHMIVDKFPAHLPAGSLVADKRKINMMIKTLNS